VPIPSTIGQGHDQEGLAAKIVALEHEAEERRVAKVKEREQRQLLVHQQEEQRRRDRQVRDESAMQAHLRHKTTELALKASRPRTISF
jgi:hypothetical protein